ncbi:hypothetical protein SDC9_113720 [bioreactor metagenome]|uniref:Uncharacterized protein n=1 Tax=bioreactor metagenome TaxID=1076179 RepID=A0A645BNW3_9ZZZZ
MEYRNFVPKPLPKEPYGLRGERNLRHEHNRLSAKRETPLDGVHVDFRLAAAGDPMQKQRTFFCGLRACDCFYRLLLRLRERNVLFRRERGKVRPAEGNVAAFHEIAALDQRADGA